MSTNPKDLMGIKKVRMSLVSPIGMIEEARAMQYGAYESPRADGGFGYGPFNWRDQQISLSVYMDAIDRHKISFWDGEDYAKDSLVHHVAHMKAGCGIVLDAYYLGCLIDDRPPKGMSAELLEKYKIKTEKEKKKYVKHTGNASRTHFVIDGSIDRTDLMQFDKWCATNNFSWCLRHGDHQVEEDVSEAETKDGC